MQRWRGLDHVPFEWGRCVATVGVFDGVHRGHRALLARLVDRARDAGLPSLVLTFDPPPSEVLSPGTRPAALTTLRYRAELLEALGVDVLCAVPFTPTHSRLELSEFVHTVLVQQLHVAAVVAGENLHWDGSAGGGAADLQADGARFGFAVETVALDGDGKAPVSSTLVRASVAAGQVEEAARALGRDHRVEGVVVQGDQRGRTIGFPTANVSPVPSSALPADGVYAGRLLRWVAPGQERRAAGVTPAADALMSPGTVTRLPAAISIGTNPTFAGQERRVEVHVLNPQGGAPPHLDLYGEHVGVEFTARLRAPVRFGSVDELVHQLQADVARTRTLLEKSR